MTEPVYEWKGDHFCEGDIVGALTLDKPWSAWLDTGGDPDATPGDEILDEIADYFNINRYDMEQVKREGFPIRRWHSADGENVFCSTCLRWFVIATT